jgi:GTPase SAR1 family protein
MAISLKSLKRTTAEKPPRILIYGSEGVGKTSLAAEFPDAAFIRVEDGIPSGVDVMAFPVALTFADVMSQLGEIYEAGGGGIRTVVVDSVTEMQKLIFAETCARGDEKGAVKASIEGFGYGKGYVFAMAVLNEFLEALNLLRTDCGITVILIAHSNVVQFADPETDSYNRYEIALRTHDKTNADLRGAVAREMDAILFLNSPREVRADEGTKDKRRVVKSNRIRKIYAEATPAFIAKNRYGIPPELRYDPGMGYAALAPYLPTHGGSSPAIPFAAGKKEAA